MYFTCVLPIDNQPPPRGSLVSMLMLDGEASSRISIRSSASFAAAGVCRLRDLLRDDFDGVAGRRLDLDLAVDVADLDAATGRELVGLAPLGGLAVLEIGGDDVAPLKRDEADEQERHGDGRRDAGPRAERSEWQTQSCRRHLRALYGRRGSSRSAVARLVYNRPPASPRPGCSSRLRS